MYKTEYQEKLSKTRDEIEKLKQQCEGLTSYQLQVTLNKIKELESLCIFYEEKAKDEKKQLGADVTKILSEKPTEELETVRLAKVHVNEEEVMSDHLKRIMDLERKLRANQRIVDEKNGADKHKYMQAQNAVMSLQEQINELKQMSREQVIWNAQAKKAAYYKAQERFRNLSPLEQLRQKIAGKTVDWDKIKSDPAYTDDKLDTMYQGKAI